MTNYINGSIEYFRDFLDDGKKERKREIGTHSFSLRVKTGTEPEIESIFHGRCFSIVNYASI